MLRSSAGIVFAVLASLALPAQALNWQQVRHDQNAMLWVDVDSINTKAGETSATYMVDFRQALEAPHGKHYRSIVVRTKIHCKEKVIATLHTDGYEQWRGGGFIVVKTSDTPDETALHTLEKNTSDEDVWHYVCEVRKGSPPPKSPPAKAPPAKSPPPKK
jgi:hypothetical protein